jgi:hypothetical protein
VLDTHIARHIYRPASQFFLTGAILPHQFVSFFPLQAAVNRGIVHIVGNEAIPPEYQEFPIFRCGVVDPT